ncbi:ferric-dicitrate binding protein FerR, regulates iron transport through sigma-19 [Porphyromonadaceae bacterium KH3CP3RA]|jgi:transmembrane sensor|nr:ferric-dicitrate binding protein FerR, regulates iron transport through sigma-19 [Porphyromonadaceae bacterium KH3CP3RA]
MNMSEEIIGLVEKFLSNSISKEEMHGLLQAYQKKQISEKQLDEYYASKWRNAEQYSSPFADESKKRVWEQFQKHIYQRSQMAPKQKSRWLLYAGGAAVAVLFFILGISLQLIRENAQQELVVTVQNGQKASVQLPDGSHVQLNSASELRYSPDFGKKNRTVQLAGEAYFDVKSNPDNPFIVLTHSGFQAKALGTKFNIKSYINDKQITGTLIEGSIEVSSTQFSEILSPNERISFDTKEMMFYKSRINNANEAIFWMTDQFVFDKETLENIAKMLERMYNVTFSFTSSDIKEIQYSGKIKNNSMENVLNLITIVSPLQYTITGSHITFSKKQK